MTTYIFRRVLLGVIIIILVSMMVFLFMRLLSGDPLLLFVSKDDMQQVTPEQMALLKHKFGLDDPMPVQYIKWLGGMFIGKLGLSVYYGEEVSGIIAKHLPVTGYLGVVTLILSSILGILFGVICALKRGKFIDTLLTFLANWSITIPAFWLGILLIYLFTIDLPPIVVPGLM